MELNLEEIQLVPLTEEQQKSQAKLEIRRREQMEFLTPFLDSYFDMIKDHVIDNKELSLDIPLPLVFTKVNADDEVDIGKKLDKGNDLLFLLVEGQNDIKNILSSVDKTLKTMAKKGD